MNMILIVIKADECSNSIANKRSIPKSVALLGSIDKSWTERFASESDSPTHEIKLSCCQQVVRIARSLIYVVSKLHRTAIPLIPVVSKLHRTARSLIPVVSKLHRTASSLIYVVSELHSDSQLTGLAFDNPLQLIHQLFVNDVEVDYWSLHRMFSGYS